MQKGKLYLIATPIGNLGDITLRAIETLKAVDLIAAEDTRTTLKLLNHLNITKPLISYHRHSEETKTTELIEKLNNGENIGLVTDAGTPGISDPGEEIVKEAIKNDVDIIPIPGACAAINALVTSGFSTKEFIFYGFLPQNKKLRKEKFKDIKFQNKTIIIYEAPHRLIETLNEFKEEFGNIQIAIAKELTKIHEKFIRGNIDDVVSKIGTPRGEYIIIFEMKGKSEEQQNIEAINELSIKEQYSYYEKKGMEKKEIIKTIAKNNNVSKNEIYKQFI